MQMKETKIILFFHQTQKQDMLGERLPRKETIEKGLMPTRPK